MILRITRSSILFTCIVLLVITCIPSLVFASDAPTYVRDYDKTIFCIDTIDDLCKEYEANTFRFIEKYKDKYIGIIAVIESIASDGKTVRLKSSASIDFVCNSSKKPIKNSVRTLSKNDLILVYGTVESVNESKLELSPVAYRCISEEDSRRYDNGIIVGLYIYPGTDLIEDEIQPVSFRLKTSWNFVRDTVRGNEVIIVDFGNDEILTIGSFQYDEILRKAELRYNKGKKFAIWNQNIGVDNYLTETLVHKRLVYSSDTETINGKSFDYMYGATSQGGNQQLKQAENPLNQAEAYYFKNGNYMVSVTYTYKSRPNHAREVAMVLASLNVY